MNNKSQISGEIMEAAADWCDRLETLSGGEREALRHWLAADPAHARAFARMRRTMLDVALLDAADAVPVQTKPQSSWRSRLSGLFESRAGYGVLASAALAIFVMVIVWPKGQPLQPNAPAEQVLQTAIGQRSNTTLADKSEVYLNAATNLSVRYTARARLLTLSRGEAIFQVAKDKSRPFRVAAGTTTVIAVGTRFGVDRVGGAVEVRVYEGTVKVDREGVSAQYVTRGQWLLIDPKHGTHTGEFAPEQYENWRSGWLEADGMPLSYVIARLSRYSNDKIVLSDAKLGEISLTGRFRLNNTDSTLQQIAALLDVDVVKRDHQVLLTPKT